MQIPISIALLICFRLFIPPQGNDNEVIGKVTIPKIERKIKRGNGYNKDGTKMMHSDDPMAKLENNVIVSLHPTSFEPELRPMQDASITQREQTFLPAVLPVTKGTTVYFLNEDEFFHNIYSLTPGSRFNIGRRPPGSPYPLKIKKIGPIKLACDIHPHMYGIILSLDTPYFSRVDASGEVQFRNIPDGTYIVKVFHPELRTKEYNIQVKGGERKVLNIDLSV